MEEIKELYLICDDTDEQYILEHKEEFEEMERKMAPKAAEIEARIDEIFKKYGLKRRRKYAAE